MSISFRDNGASFPFQNSILLQTDTRDRPWTSSNMIFLQFFRDMADKIEYSPHKIQTKSIDMKETIPVL